MLYGKCTGGGAFGCDENTLLLLECFVEFGHQAGVCGLWEVALLIQKGQQSKRLTQKQVLNEQ